MRISRRSLETKQFVRTVTGGWRFTLPVGMRKALGWREGEVLAIRLQDSGLEIFATAEAAQSSGPRSESGLKDYWLPVYLGSGGKIVVPVEMREKLGWEIGQRLAVRMENQVVSASPCCPRIKCRSCGKEKKVKEVIQNLYLCEDCWANYVTRIWKSQRETGLTFGKLARESPRRYN